MTTYVTATTAGSAHPLYLYNLQPSHGTTGTPLTYPSPPTPSTIPGNVACYGWPTGVPCLYPAIRKRWPAPAPDADTAAQTRRQNVAAADCPAPTIPAFLTTATSYPASRLSSACSCALASASPPTTTTTCTAIGATWPETTIPAFCQPSFHANRASLVPLPGITSTAVATLGVVSDKLDCCVSCAGIYNCIAWSYVPFPSPTSTTTAAAAAITTTTNEKINPWISGMCVAVYNYGMVSPSNDNAVAVCPNGVVGETLGGASSNPSAGGQFRWENLYYNGWNEGPCGRPLNVFQSGQDAGMGDYDTLCR
ncbi:hypothetical protein PG996_001512 [Apiospora saccharicola]|uniref:Uncharacterized protein n=1 Tax=Apiospora saccharicola TaxID=335842 RepID=A0ABR1WJQ5_9PEZI